jgi:hypothetical protein
VQLILGVKAESDYDEKTARKTESGLDGIARRGVAAGRCHFL